MIETLLQQERELKRAKLNSETARIPWLELQRFFAAGKMLLIANDLDLIDVAYAIAQDDAEAVQTWTETGRLAAVSDADARRWLASQALLWAVVVKPWVLVQASAQEDGSYY